MLDINVEKMKPINRLYGIFIMLLIVMLMAIPCISAMDWDNIKEYDSNEKKITIYNSIFPKLIKGKKLAEYTLNYNTDQCVFNCYAEGTLNLYVDSKLMNGFYFEGDVVNERVLIEVNEEYPTFEFSIKKKCIENVNGTYCYKDYNPIKTTATEKKWIEYQGEMLDKGYYRWRIEAEKKSVKAEWVINALGFNFKEWAWWNSSWDYYKEITFNITTLPENYTHLLEIDYDAHMNSDFSDLRFIDSSETKELEYWMDNYTTIDGDKAYVYVNTNGNSTIYMYYGNAGASTTSSAADTFLIFDHFNAALGVIWVACGGKTVYSNPVASILSLDGGDACCTDKCMYYNQGVNGNVSSVSLINFSTSGGEQKRIGLMNADDIWTGATSSGYAFQHGSATIYGRAEDGGGAIDSVLNITTLIGVWDKYEVRIMDGKTDYYINNTLVNSTTRGDGVAKYYNINSNTGGPQIDYFGVYQITSPSPNYTIGAEQEQNTLATTLNSPVDYYNSTTKEIIFNCSAIDDESVYNITLILDGEDNYTVQAGEPSYDNVVANLRFNGDADDSGPLSLSPVSSGVDYVTGVIGQAASLRDISDVVNLTGQIADYIDKNITYCFWLNTSQSSATANIVRDRGLDTLNIGPDTNLEIGSHNSTGYYSKQYAGYTIGTWQHVCGTLTDGNMSLYVDGDPVLSFQMSNPDSMTTEIDVGYGGGVAGAWIGEIDELKIFNSTLDANAVGQMYAYEKNGGSLSLELTRTYNMSEGSHNWTCISYDLTTNSTATAQYYTIDSTPPLVQAYNLTNLVSETPPVSSHWNFSAVDSGIGLDSCYFNTSDNATLSHETCNQVTIETIWYSGGAKTVYYCANDTLGNEGCNSSSIQVYSVTTDYNATPIEVGEGANVLFTLSVNLTDINTTTASLIANNSVYSVSGTPHQNYTNFSKLIAIPNGWGNVSGNYINWRWNYSVLGVITDAQTPEDQIIVYKAEIDDCTAHADPILNLSLKDEETNSEPDLENKSSKVEIDLRIWKGSDEWNFSATWHNQSNMSVCVPSGLLTATNYSIEFLIGFDYDDHVREFFMLDNGTLSNSTYFNTYTTRNVNLMDLLAVDSTSFLFTFLDENNLEVEDAIVHVFRQYIGDGVYREVERSTQDDEGNALIHLVEEDVVYYFMITQYGDHVFTSNSYNAKCLSTPCQIELTASEDFSPFPEDFDMVEGGGYSLETDYATRIVSLSWTVTPSREMNMSIYKYSNNPDDITFIGSNSSNDTNGVVSLVIPQVAGNTTFFAAVFQDEVHIASEFIDLNDKGYDYFGVTGVFLGVIMIVALVLIFIGDGLGILIGLIIGVIGACGMLFLDLNWYILIGLIVAIAIVIWKITSSRRKG